MADIAAAHTIDVDQVRRNAELIATLKDVLAEAETAASAIKLQNLAAAASIGDRLNLMRELVATVETAVAAGDDGESCLMNFIFQLGEIGGRFFTRSERVHIVMFNHMNVSMAQHWDIGGRKGLEDVEARRKNL